MTYDSQLPTIFPYRIDAPENEVQHIVTILVTSRPGASNGSSFAVTSDAHSGRRYIWLSNASYDTLRAAGVIPDLYESVQP